MRKSNIATKPGTLDSSVMSVIARFGAPAREKMAVARRVGPAGVTWIEQKDPKAPKLAIVPADEHDIAIAGSNLYGEGRFHENLQKVIDRMGHDHRDPASAKEACAKIMADYFATPTVLS